MDSDHFSPQPISYALLNGFEISILSARPLVESNICRLYKSTLSRFLINNGVQCDWRCAKSLLIDLVFQLVADHEDCEARSYSPPPELAVWEPRSCTTNNVAPPRQPCSCHECQHSPPPLPVARYNWQEYERSETPDSEASDDVNDSLFIIEPCNALLTPDELEAEEDNECACDVPVEQLLKRVNLRSDSKHMFRSVANSSIPEIVAFLQNFGVEVEGSGCRIHLLLMLRDLLEEQSNAMKADNTEYLQVFGGALRDALNKREVQRTNEELTKEAEAAKEKAPPPTTDEDPSQECCICLQNQRSIAFVPCGHTLCCGVCARKLKECPVCRKKILRRLKLFFS